MERKDFLKGLGGLCAGAGLFSCGCGRALSLDQEVPKGTPLDRRFEWAQIWVKRFMDVLDSELDVPTRTRVMEEMGRVCNEGSLKGRSIQPLPARDLVERIKKSSGEESARLEGNIIHFQYTRSPKGLSIADGFCLCPLVEKGPEGLSGTFCHCSVGYVRNMFSRYLGKPVEVELLESLKRGGKTCLFRITLP